MCVCVCLCACISVCVGEGCEPHEEDLVLSHCPFLPRLLSNILER